MATALARAGERVHVIAHRWPGAPHAQEVLEAGNLIVHRVALDDAPSHDVDRGVPEALLASSCPVQAFSWQAAQLAERLVVNEGVDVVESQEWEAPLYHFQLRRDAGLGPARRPPCIVHVHSPSATIFAANEWDRTVADFAPLAAMEAFSITRADAVLCPSRFIADQVLADYGVDPARVTVIPYPRVDVAVAHRDDGVWNDEVVCHVGRLEPRKGVLEWAEAIATLSREFPAARFEFVGADTPLAVTGGRTVQRAMLARLPRHARSRVTFHGSKPPADVAALLARASIAVIPSRWENLPFSCIEAMSTGLPVLVSPHGGMRELVADGVSGWIADDGSPAGLVTAARRALGASGAERRAMGEVAAAAVRRHCDPTAVVCRHLEMRQALQWPPGDVPAIGVPPAVTPSSIPPDVGVVVDGDGPAAAATLESLRALGASAAQLMVGAATAWRPSAVPTAQEIVADLAGAARAFAASGDLAAVVVVEAGAAIEPDFVARARAWLARDGTLGVVVPWVRTIGSGEVVVVRPGSATQPLDAESVVAPAVVVRTAALPVAARTRDALVGQAAAAGWRTVPFPSIAATMPSLQARPSVRRRLSAMASAVQRCHMPVGQWLRACSPEERRRLVAEGLRNPVRSLRWVAGRLSTARRLPRAEPILSTPIGPDGRPPQSRRGL